jgi:hypothetical protein
MLKTAHIGQMATNVWLTPFMSLAPTAAEWLILWKKQRAKRSSFENESWGTAYLLKKQKSSPFHT